jgi:DNA-binding transcriptional regulator YdaS (Cro superfamily)
MTHLEIFFLTQERGAKTDLAKMVGVSKTWISQIISGKMQPSAQLAIKIELATGVPRELLRPDLFGGVHIQPRVAVPMPDQSLSQVAQAGQGGSEEVVGRVDEQAPVL